MVLAAKIFMLKPAIDLDLIAEKLSVYKEEKEVNEHLLTIEFKDFRFLGDELRCIFSEDRMIDTYYKGEVRSIPVTMEARLIFKVYDGRIFLIIMERKDFANYIANKVSEALFIKIGEVIESEISHETLKLLHESNPGASKVIFFDNVDIPNIRKLSLYGSALSDTSLYSMYLEHGKIWYVVFEFKKYGYIVGITRNCVLAMFTNIDHDSFANFIVSEILPLLS
jgi:hypothetical protein